MSDQSNVRQVSSGVRVRIRFSDWLDSGYAHAFMLLSVVIVTLPAKAVSSGGVEKSVNSFRFRLRNDLYCVEWGVKLYSLLLLVVQSVDDIFRRAARFARKLRTSSDRPDGGRANRK